MIWPSQTHATAAHMIEQAGVFPMFETVQQLSPEARSRAGRDDEPHGWWQMAFCRGCRAQVAPKATH